MKILVLGDFHGKFPKKLKDKIKKENADLVVSLGDFFPFSYRKIWFKHCYKNDTELWEVIGKKKMKELIKKDFKCGEKVLKKLNKIKIPIISITGNLDYTKWRDAYDVKKPKWSYFHQDFFSKIIKKYKNIKIFDYSFVKFQDIVFIGMATSTFPGKVKSKNYKKMRRRLDKLFEKFRNEKVIFVSHNVPYKTKLSKINSKKGPKEVQGMEKGSKLSRRIIEKYQPLLNFAGHMHENQGKCKIGKTLVVNPGAVVDGKCAIVNLEKGKMKIKFII